MSMTFFSAANVMINRGSHGRSRSRGAFLSIVITVFLSAAIWLGYGLRDGFMAPNRVAVYWFALAGLLTVLIGRVFVYASIQSLGAMRASAIKRLTPFFSVVLGVLLLGETINKPMAVGMVLIFLSFVVLAQQSLKDAGQIQSSGKQQSVLRKLAGLGYLYGPLSALGYASGYIARKQGLVAMPDAVFGTLLGSATGMILFVAISAFVDSYREDLRKSFSEFNPWLLAAGFFASFGQISYFVALKFSSVSKIALITSMEVFLTMLLSYIVFRGKFKITRVLLLAAALAATGTIVVIRN